MNAQDVFVGRKIECSAIEKHLSYLTLAAVNDQPRLVDLHGEGGIGKTKLAAEIGRRLCVNNYVATPVIDVRESRNRTILSLLRTIASQLPSTAFGEFFTHIENYAHSTDSDRSRHHYLAVETFKDGLKTISLSHPVVIIIDTLESIQGTKFLETIMDLLPHCGGRCGFVLAGRNPLQHISQVARLNFKIPGFLVSDIEKMARRMFAARHQEYFLESVVFERLLSATGGKPILCGLAIDWLMENPDQTQYITGLGRDTFEREIILSLKALETPEIGLIKLMAAVVRGIDAPLVALLTGMGETECKGVIDRLRRFSFVRTLSSENMIALHDEIVRLVCEHYVIGESEEILRPVVGYYTEKTSEPGWNNVRDKGLIADILYYRLKAGRRDGLRYCDVQFESALESYDYDLCALLINELSQFRCDPEVKNMEGLYRAELLIAQYNPMEAKLILDEMVADGARSVDPIFSARISEGYGNTITNACTIVGADLFKAVEHFKESFDVYKKPEEHGRIAKCLMALGKAFVYIGRHEDAEAAFSLALSNSKELRTHKLSAKILDEMGEMHRLQQNVEKALGPLKESHDIRMANGDEVNLGVYYFYLGNTCRDLDNFEEADKYYKLAESHLQSVNDTFRLCELYCEMSWRRRLSEDFDEAEALIEQMWKLARKHKFGTEYSEYFHIKYEIAIAKGDVAVAYEALDKALAAARKYSNIYIVLDCLNHCAQRAYAQGKCDEIPAIIEEMRGYESRGCGIKVFTGRAVMVLGDAHHDKGNYDAAFECWKEGLTTIALYGNSRTNIELFEDIFAKRRYRFQPTLAALGEEARKSLVLK